MFYARRWLQRCRLPLPVGCAQINFSVGGLVQLLRAVVSTKCFEKSSQNVKHVELRIWAGTGRIDLRSLLINRKARDPCRLELRRQLSPQLDCSLILLGPLGPLDLLYLSVARKDRLAETILLRNNPSHRVRDDPPCHRPVWIDLRPKEGRDLIRQGDQRLVGKMLLVGKGRA